MLFILKFPRPLSHGFVFNQGGTEALGTAAEPHNALLLRQSNLPVWRKLLGVVIMKVIRAGEGSPALCSHRNRRCSGENKYAYTLNLN